MTQSDSRVFYIFIHSGLSVMLSSCRFNDVLKGFCCMMGIIMSQTANSTKPSDKVQKHGSKSLSLNPVHFSNNTQFCSWVICKILISSLLLLELRDLRARAFFFTSSSLKAVLKKCISLWKKHAKSCTAQCRILICGIWL